MVRPICNPSAAFYLTFLAVVLLDELEKAHKVRPFSTSHKTLYIFLG